MDLVMHHGEHRGELAKGEPGCRALSIFLVVLALAGAGVMYLIGRSTGVIPSITSSPTHAVVATPSSTPVPPAASTTHKPTRPKVRHYTVRSGDTLRSIALRFYGRTSAARHIYYANKPMILAHGGVVVPGMRLAIPPL